MRLLDAGVVVREGVAGDVVIAVDDFERALAAHRGVEVSLGLDGWVEQASGATARSGLEHEHGGGAILDADDRAQALARVNHALADSEHGNLQVRPAPPADNRHDRLNSRIAPRGGAQMPPEQRIRR